jgi:hypothetical protein
MTYLFNATCSDCAGNTFTGISETKPQLEICPVCESGSFTSVSDYDSIPVNFDTVNIMGVVYISTHALAFGDYGGSGSIGAGNIAFLKAEHDSDKCETIPWSLMSWAESYGKTISGMMDCYGADSYFGGPAWRVNPPEILFTHGGHGSEQAWIRSDIMESADYWHISDYPCFEDEYISQIESQWEDEAWESWVESDLKSTFSDEYQEHMESVDSGKLSDVTYQAYRDAMESESQYPEPEYNGVHIPVDAIAESWRKYVQIALKRSDHAVIRMVDNSYLDVTTPSATASFPIGDYAGDYRKAMNQAIAWCNDKALTWESI